MKGKGQPEHIADVVSFLASDDARWITARRSMSTPDGAPLEQFQEDVKRFSESASAFA